MPIYLNLVNVRISFLKHEIKKQFAMLKTTPSCILKSGFFYIFWKNKPKSDKNQTSYCDLQYCLSKTIHLFTMNIELLYIPSYRHTMLLKTKIQLCILFLWFLPDSTMRDTRNEGLQLRYLGILKYFVEYVNIILYNLNSDKSDYWVV